MLSLVIPVYQNEGSLHRLLAELQDLKRHLNDELEVIFVVDGSPDRSLSILEEELPKMALRTQLIVLSRNFGSFNAILAGLNAGSGEQFAVLAADLQEPPSLVVRFHDMLKSGGTDIVFGVRASRSDPWLSELASRAFWILYRRLVVKEMPSGGVDVFGCTREVRDLIVRFREVNTNLIALLFWVGFRRGYVSYERAPRRSGTSAWTIAKKLQYCVDSVFNFTDLPIRLLMVSGAAGSLLAVAAGIVVVTARLRGKVPVEGYTVIVLSILFFGGLIMLGLGIIGQYLWLSLKNARGRPNYIVARSARYFGTAVHDVVPGAAAEQTRRVVGRQSPQ